MLLLAGMFFMNRVHLRKKFTLRPPRTGRDLDPPFCVCVRACVRVCVRKPDVNRTHTETGSVCFR